MVQHFKDAAPVRNQTAQCLQVPIFITAIPLIALSLLSTNKPQEIAIPFNIAEAPARKLGCVKTAVHIPDEFFEVLRQLARENGADDVVAGGFLRFDEL